MYVKKLTGYLFACFVVLGGTCLSAPTAHSATAQQRIDQYTREAEAIIQRRDLLKQQLAELQVSMETAQQQDSPEKAAWDAAQQRFDEFSERFEQDPSAQNESRLRNAEFKLHLAERKYRRGNGELNALENQYGQVKTELTELRQQLKSLDQKIAEQRRVQELTRNKRKEEAQKKAEAERAAARQKVNRQETAQNKAQSSESSVPKANEGSEKILLASTNKAPIMAASESSEPLELDDNFFLLVTPEQVEHEKGRLENKTGGKAARLRTNKILNISHMVNGQEESKNSHRFKGLGNYQFRAEARLNPGQNNIRVSFDRWTINVPPELAGKEYVFLMDDSRGNEPRIACYPISLD